LLLAGLSLRSWLCPAFLPLRRRASPSLLPGRYDPTRASTGEAETPLPSQPPNLRTRRHTREATVAHRSGRGNHRRRRAVRSVLVRRRKGTHFAGRARPAGKAASRDSAFSRSRVKGRFHVPAPPIACFFLIVSFRAPLIGDSSTPVTPVGAVLRSVAPHFSVASRGARVRPPYGFLTLRKRNGRQFWLLMLGFSGHPLRRSLGAP
jgi:hypothetical protein